ncbi:MAG: tyrosine-type recombinase/integrase [Erythrobacter sp.]|nr:tyrosine-type recombinase/integrase [Erythrobacter sp.]
MVKNVDLPFLHRKVSKGRTYYYFVRAGHKRIRLPGQPGEPEFLAAYSDARAGKHIEAAYSFNMLIDSYQASDRWTRLKPRTQSDYRKVLDYLRERQGPKDFTLVRRKDVINAMHANLHRKRFANMVAQVMSVLFEHAIDMGWLERNHAKGVKLMRGGEGYKPWPRWAVDAYRAEATGMAALIFELGIGTGQRPGDLPGMRWDDFDGEYIRVKQNKTDAKLWIYCPPRLRALLEQTPRKGLTILTRDNGQPLDYNGVQARTRPVRKRSGTYAYTLHGLRYSAVVEMAEAGVSDRDIMAVTGHKTTAMVTKYAGEARTKVRSKRAQEAREV